MGRVIIESGDNLGWGDITTAILNVLYDLPPVRLPSYKGVALNKFFLPRLERTGIGRSRKNRVQTAVERLRRQKCIERIAMGDHYLLGISERGRKRLEINNMRRLSLKPLGSWDRTWRIVIFDIPEQKKRARDGLARKLKELGFFKLQRSVFAHYLPCKEEVQHLAKFWDIEEQIGYIEAKSIGNQEVKLRKHFGLK